MVCRKHIWQRYITVPNCQTSQTRVDTIKYSQHAEKPNILNEKVQLVQLLLKVSRHWKMTGKIRISDFSVCCIIKDITGMQKSSNMLGYTPPCQSDKQCMCTRVHTHACACTLANFNPEWYHSKGDAFLCYIIALNRDDTINTGTFQ
jgi:hypothetical protein